MTNRGRTLTIVWGVFAGIATVVAITSIVLQIRERELRLEKEQQLLLAKAENEDLSDQLRRTRLAQQQAEAELNQAQSQLEQALHQAAEARQASEALTQAVEARQQEVDRLTKDLEQIRADRAALAEQVVQLETLQREVKSLRQAKADLESKVLELSEHPTVQLDPVLITQGGVTEGGGSSARRASDQPLQGHVLVVNREYDFIVVNLGRNQGLSIGQEFQVVRGQEVLGHVKIEKIYDELSAAAILPNSNKDAIREGDSVRPI